MATVTYIRESKQSISAMKGVIDYCCQDKKVYDANLRLLVDEIKIYESDKKLNITINLKANFIEHMVIFGEDKDYNLELQLNTKQRKEILS